MALRLLASPGKNKLPLLKDDLDPIGVKKDVVPDLLKSIKPPDVSPVAAVDVDQPEQRLNLLGKTLTASPVSAGIDALANIVSGTTDVQKAEDLKMQQMANITKLVNRLKSTKENIPPIADFLKRPFTPAEEGGRMNTFVDFADMLTEGPFAILGKAFAPAVGGITSAIHGPKESLPAIIESAMKGIVDPEKAPRLFKALDKPLTEFERGGKTKIGSVARLIPRATGEAMEIVALSYMLGIPGATKRAIKGRVKSIKKSGALKDIDAGLAKIDPAKVMETVDKQGLFPRRFTQKEKMQSTLDFLEAERGKLLANKDVVAAFEKKQPAFKSPTEKLKSKAGELFPEKGKPKGKKPAPKKITDPARIQEIKNRIAEGEMLLRSGKKVSGEKMSPEELESVKQSVESAKAKIGETISPAKPIKGEAIKVFAGTPGKEIKTDKPFFVSENLEVAEHYAGRSKEDFLGVEGKGTIQEFNIDPSAKIKTIKAEDYMAMLHGPKWKKLWEDDLLDEKSVKETQDVNKKIIDEAKETGFDVVKIEGNYEATPMRDFDSNQYIILNDEVISGKPKGIDAQAETEIKQFVEKKTKLSDDVVRHLKVKANADKLGEKLAKEIPPRKYKTIIESEVRIRKVSPPVTVKTTERTGLKEKLRKEAAVARKGFAAGKKKGLVDEKTRAKEVLDKKKGREKLSEEIKTMLKYVKDVPTKNLPVEYKDAIEDIKLSIDFDNARLSKIIKKTKIVKDFERPSDVTEINAGDMSVRNLREVFETVQMIQHEGSIGNKLLTVEEGKNFEETVTKGVASIDKSGGITKIPNIEKVEGWLDKSKELKSKFIAENRRPEALIDSFDKYKPDGTNFNAMFRPLNDSINQKLENIEETTTKIAKIFKNVNIAAALGKRMKVKGIKRPITRDEMIFIYANSFNDINIEHLKNSGITEETFNDVAKKLPIEEREAVHDLFKFYDKDQYERIDKVYSALKGIHLPKEENYFPIQTLENIGDLEAIEMDIQNRNEFLRSGVPTGFTKERTGGKKAFKNFSFFKTVYKNLNQVEHYVSHAKGIRDASKYLRNSTVKESILRNYGQPVYDVLDRWVQDVARGRGRNDGEFLDDVAIALRGNFVMYALGANLSTVLKQPASFIQGAEYIGKMESIASLGKFAQHPIETMRFVEGKSTQMKHRAFTQERELQEILAGRGIAKRFNQRDLKELKQMIREGSMRPIMWADKMTVTILWDAAYHKTLGETGSEKAAIDFADKAIRRTQPQSRIVDLPDMFRSTQFKKMLTVFKNQPNQNFNLNYDAYKKYKQSNKDGASLRKFTSEIMFYLVASGLFFSVLSRKRLPKDWKEVALSLTNQVFGGLPIIGDLLRRVEYPWGSANMIDGAVDEATKIITSKKAGTKLKHAGRLLGQTLGAPGYVAVERAITRESLQTKIVGGERKKEKKTSGLRLLGGKKKSGGKSKLRLLQ